jgi:hypothetical protein
MNRAGLPSRWCCADNTTDPAHACCDAPEIPDPCDTDDSADEYFDTGAILDERTASGGRAEFLVQWEGYESEDDAWVDETAMNKDLVSALRRRQGGIQGGSPGDAGPGGGIQGGGSAYAGQAGAATSAFPPPLADNQEYLTPAEFESIIGFGAAAAGWTVMRSLVNGRMTLRAYGPNGQPCESLQDAAEQFKAAGGAPPSETGPQAGTGRELSRSEIDVEVGVGAYDAGWRGTEHPAPTEKSHRMVFKAPDGRQIRSAFKARAAFENQNFMSEVASTVELSEVQVQLDKHTLKLKPHPIPTLTLIFTRNSKNLWNTEP